MTTTTKTIETENATITVALTRQVNDKKSYADGYNIATGRELYQCYDVQITSKRNGKSIRASHPEIKYLASKMDKRDKAPAGAYARVGDAYISEELYSLIVAALIGLDAEIGKTDEQVALEAEAETRRQIGLKNVEREEAKLAERAKHPGYCPKCGSYCYGDCDA